MTFSTRFLLISVLLSVFAPPSQAQGTGADARVESRASLGGTLGWSHVDHSVGGGIGYGLNGAYFFNENMGLGAFIRGGNHDNGVSSFFYGAEGLYRLSQFVPGLQGGVVLGLGKFSAGGFTGNTDLAFGAKAAYDHPISSYPLTAGLDASLVFTEPGTVTLTVINVLATAKWWF